MRIVCATDFSVPARAAADRAGAVAVTCGDIVKLLHIVVLPPLIGEEAAAAGAARWETAMREAAARELGRARQALADRGVAAEVAVQIGPAAELIRTEAAAKDMRLVVVGTHGRKGAAHFFLGSVAEDVARSCPCPVVVTRGVPFPEDGLDPRRRLHLMLAVDGSAGAEAALAWAKHLRAKVPCNVTLVQPCWPPAEAERFGLPQAWAGGRQIHPSLLPLLDRELRRWAGEFPGEGELHCRFPASHGRLAEDLATEAEVLLPDLVVLGVTRRPFGGLSGLTTQGALHAIKIPVVCVPEGMRPPPADGIPVVATVLVGTDMSDFSNQAIAGAYSLLRGTGGSVEICFVYERGAGSESAMDLPAESPPLPSLKVEIEQRLRQLIPRDAAGLGIRTAVNVVEASSAEDGLLHEAERIGADVLVVASHGKAGIKRTLIGSVADHVVRRRTRPVLVLYPRPR
jgi:nucleotide-binding universal stress UspA family protein